MINTKTVSELLSGLYWELTEEGQYIVMRREQFADKKQVLELVDKMEIVGPIDLVNHFGISYNGAIKRIQRLRDSGLIERIGVEESKWTLSVLGDNQLTYLRRKENVKRR